MSKIKIPDHINIPDYVKIEEIDSLYQSYLDGNMSDEALYKTIYMFSFIKEFLEKSNLCNALLFRLTCNIESLEQCADYRENNAKRIKALQYKITDKNIITNS